MRPAVAHLVAVLILLIVSVLLATRPYYNYDMFRYMALALSDDSIPFEDIHRKVYLSARQEMPPEDYTAVTIRRPTLRDDPEKFRETLKYFQVKPGYVFVVKVLYKVGVPLTAATYFPSIASYFLLGCLLLFVQRDLPSIMSSLSTLIIMALPPVVEGARLSTPDMLATLLVMTGLLLFFSGKTPWAFVPLLLSVTVRPDAALPGFVLLVVGLATARLSMIPAATWFLALTATMVFSLGNMNLLLEYLFTATDYDPEWSWAQAVSGYLDSLYLGLRSWVATKALTGFMACGVYLYLNRNHTIRESPWKAMVLVALIIYPLRFTLHPQMEDRFLLVPYIIVVMAFIRWLNSVALTHSPLQSL